MYKKYISIVVLLSIIGFSSFKINKHKDDANKKNLVLYSGITALSSMLVIYFIYLILTTLTPRDVVINAVLNDFLQI